MNLQQLRDILTIAREGSITKASRVLFKAQPNLSNMLREVEDELQITIFERTPTGVTLTPQGERFAAQASGILTQMDQLMQIGQQPEEKLTLGISVCRASYCVRAVSAWMDQTLDPEHPFSLHLHETNTDEAIDQVFHAESSLGIIRMPNFFENHYLQQLENKGLCWEPLMDFTMMLIMRKNHPLASVQNIQQRDLYRYTEIVHGDQQIPALSMARINPLLHGTPPRRIYVYDRGSQIDLLQRLPDTYMWASPIPLDMVDDYGMCIRRCALSTVVNRDMLIWRKESIEDARLRSCGEFLRDYASELSYRTAQRLEQK